MKIIQVWLLLTPKERQHAAQWIPNNLPKYRKEALQLLAYLHTKKIMTTTDYDKKTAFAAIYGEAVTYNDNAIRQAQSFLIVAIERFVAAQAMLADNATAAYHIAAFYTRQAQNERFFHEAIADLNTENNAVQGQDEMYFSRAVRTNNLLLQHHITQRNMDATVLQNILYGNEKLATAAHLRSVCTALSFQNFTTTAFDFGILPALLQRIEQQAWHKTEPIIGAYYYIYKMTTEPENEIFFLDFRQNMPDYRAIFTRKEQQECYLAAINYVIKYINKGKNKFEQANTTPTLVLFDLYKEGFEYGVLLNEDNSIAAVTYRNVIATALRIGQTAYALVFLEQYKSALPRNKRNNFYEHSLAKYYFTIKDFKQAMPLLLGLSSGDLFIQLDAKTILMKIYYETDDFDAFDTHLKAFQQFLYRKRVLLAYHQVVYQNTIAFAKQLITINRLDKQAVENLRTAIQNTNPLTETAWLLAQL